MKANFLLAASCVGATLPATGQNRIEDRVGESGQVLTRAQPSRLGREVTARSHSAPERMPLPGIQLWRP